MGKDGKKDGAGRDVMVTLHVMQAGRATHIESSNGRAVGHQVLDVVARALGTYHREIEGEVRAAAWVKAMMDRTGMTSLFEKLAQPAEDVQSEVVHTFELVGDASTSASNLVTCEEGCACEPVDRASDGTLVVRFDHLGDADRTEIYDRLQRSWFVVLDDGTYAPPVGTDETGTGSGLEHHLVMFDEGVTPESLLETLRGMQAPGDVPITMQRVDTDKPVTVAHLERCEASHDVSTPSMSKTSWCVHARGHGYPTYQLHRDTDGRQWETREVRVGETTDGRKIVSFEDREVGAVAPSVRDDAVTKIAEALDIPVGLLRSVETVKTLGEDMDERAAIAGEAATVVQTVATEADRVDGDIAARRREGRQ